MGYMAADTEYTSLPDDIHGELRVRPNEYDIRIERTDPPMRQELAFLHELVHHAYLPERTDSEEVHPAVHQIAQILQSRFRGVGNQGDSMDEIVLTDREKRAFRTPSNMRRPTVRAGFNSVAVKRMPDNEAAAILAEYKGWLTAILYKMWLAQSFVWPFQGVVRAAPLHDISGFRADTFEGFFRQCVQSLDTIATRTTKTYGRTAVAGGAAATAATTTGSLGCIVTLSDSKDLDNNAPFEIEHFTPGTQMDYLITPDFTDGYVQYFALHVTNDRGTGVPTARADHNAQTVAGQRRDGSVICVETVNYRDLQS
jgi:hypothetical protein